MHILTGTKGNEIILLFFVEVVLNNSLIIYHLIRQVHQ